MAAAFAACFSPHPPIGAQCSQDGTCPDGLVCVASACVPPGTQPTDASGADAEIVDAMGDAQRDAARLDGPHLDAAPLAASFVLIGSDVGTATTISSGVDRPVPAGSLVVILAAGRGVTPIIVADSAANAWTTAVQLDNSTATECSAILYSTLTTGLDGNAAINVTFSGGDNTSANDHGFTVLLASGVSALDQVGSAAGGLTTMPSATTPALTGAPELVVGVTATGFQQPSTIAPTGAFASQLAWATALSSASLDAEIDPAPHGGESYADTATQDSNYAVAVATFK